MTTTYCKSSDIKHFFKIVEAKSEGIYKIHYNVDKKYAYEKIYCITKAIAEKSYEEDGRRRV